MKKLIILFIFILLGCSDEQSVQEKEFIKQCYYSSNTQISKSECECIYSDILNTYSIEYLDKIMKDDFPREQLVSVKNQFRDNILKSYMNKCK